jgi:hypothetical protein
MDLQPPAQVFATTLYDRHQPQQQLSFVFIPARSVSGNFLTQSRISSIRMRISSAPSRLHICRQHSLP